MYSSKLSREMTMTLKPEPQGPENGGREMDSGAV